MKITFQAFSWECSNPLFSLKFFLDQMSTKQAHDIGCRKIFFIDDNGYYAGLILTIKNTKKFVTLIDKKAEITLDIHELNSNEKIADFNFFIINSQTGLGMYQYYHNSCSLSTFNNISKKFYNEIVSEKIKNTIKELNTLGQHEKYIRREIKKLESKISTKIIIREGSLVDKILKMKDITSAKIEFSKIGILDKKYSPLEKYLKTIKYDIKFIKEKSVKDVLLNLAALFRNNELKRATVWGIDETGNDVTYKLLNDFDHFNEFDYEDMIPSLTFNSSEVKKSILKNKITEELKTSLQKIDSN